MFLKEKKKYRFLTTMVTTALCIGLTACNSKQSDNTNHDNAVAVSTTAPMQPETTTAKDTVTPSIDVTKKSGTLEKTTFTRQAENLDRGLIAVSTDKGVFLSWRFLGTDSADTVFSIYRDNTCITTDPITDSTNFLDTQGTSDSVYRIEAIVKDKTVDTSKDISVWTANYLDIPLQKPDGMTMPDQSTCTYSPNDASVADLDGDGQYEIILKWEPSNAQDNSKDGYTGNTYLDACKMDGTQLWRIDLGKNIRSGAHYTPFLVYDFDGDGYAELVCRTADGTVDGEGTVIGDANADYRNPAGRILSGSEFLTLFDGQTGKALDTIDYEPERGEVLAWGDDYGNRVDRFLGAVAYLDGKKPSVIMCRGYYTRSVLVSYDVVDKKLVKRWTFDSDNGNADYAGQGNHNLAVADVDWDGKDEIVYGQCVIDDNGTGLYSTGLGHGDAIHVGDFLPEREGLEVWGCLEASFGAALWDGSTGEILLRVNSTEDTGRAVAGNFIAGNNGAEFACSANNNVYDANGNILTNWSSITKWAHNYAIYWDGDLEQEAMDRTMIDKYEVGRIFTAEGVSSINGTKANACLCGDIFGDWREEVMFPTEDGNALRIFTTTDITKYRIFTLMHDLQYRCQIAAQNAGYNQGAYTSFFLGTNYNLPGLPDIKTVSPASNEKEK